MKNLIYALSVVFASFFALSQSTKPTNVYPSNLESNMYYKGYDATKNTIDGIHFMVLADGNNSKDKTPAFEVSLYLMPEGKTSREDLIVIKTYNLDGIFHMGSHEFKNESISLAGINVSPGAYRLGIWVNSNAAFTEETSDNATLFRGTLQITASNTASQEKKSEPQKTPAQNEWNSWGEEEEDEDE